MANFFQRLDNKELSLQGLAYEVNGYYTFTGNQTKYFQVKTMTVAPLILIHSVSSSAEPFRVQWLESPTLTDGTTEVTPYNMRREVTTAAATKFYTDPTYTSGGTVVNQYLVTAGKAGGAQGGADGGHWKLKTSTSYLVKIEQLTNQSTSGLVHFHFAESYGRF